MSLYLSARVTCSRIPQPSRVAAPPRSAVTSSSAAIAVGGDHGETGASTGVGTMTAPVPGADRRMQTRFKFLLAHAEPSYIAPEDDFIIAGDPQFPSALARMPQVCRRLADVSSAAYQTHRRFVCAVQQRLMCLQNLGFEGRAFLFVDLSLQFGPRSGHTATEGITVMVRGKMKYRGQSTSQNRRACPAHRRRKPGPPWR